MNVARITGTAAALLASALSLAPLAALAQGGPPPANVRVVEASVESLAPTIELPGTVLSRNDARLAAEVSGRLNSVAEVGMRVEAGDPVAFIEDTALRLSLEENRALVGRAESEKGFLEREVNRLRKLAEQNVAARNQLDRTESDLLSAVNDIGVARARMQLIEVQLAKTRIRAPFSGIVTERLLAPGEHVQPGDAVVRLVEPDNLEVVARAPLSSVAFVTEGDMLSVDSDLNSGEGRVRTLVPFGNAQSHMFEIRAVVEGNWRVGENVRMRVPTAAPTEVLAVPRDALILRRDGITVYRIKDDNTAERVMVQTGLGDGELIAVTGALEAGDRVVVRGGERLRPGQPVNVIDDGAVTAGGPSRGTGGR